MKQSLLFITKKKVNVRKKVTWNWEQIVEVKYECYIPFRIRCSSSLLQKFSNKFDNDAEQYVRGVMKRKNLLRISDPGEQNQIQALLLAGFVKRNQIRKQRPSQPYRINPFKKKLHETTTKTTTGNKENCKVIINMSVENKVNTEMNNKKQGTLDYFWKADNGKRENNPG
jgi:hypothetical protein